MAITAMEVAWAGWVITVVGWLLAPIITLLVPKILSSLGFDASQKLRELEIHIIPELQKTMCVVDQERMLGRKKKVTSDLATLDRMAAMLRHAREDAEDILDDAQEIESRRSRDILYHALKVCNRSCVWIRSTRLLQWAPARPSEEPVLVTTRAAASDEPVSVAVDIDIAASHEQAVPVSATTASASNQQAAPVAATTPAASNGQVVRVTAPLDVFKNGCRYILCWIIHAIGVACFYRNSSYEVVGITNNQENATMFDFALAAIPVWNLKKRIEKVEITVGDVKKSPLLGVASKGALEDIANKNRSKIRTASNPKVFGRELLRDSIMDKLRETPHCDAPSSSTSPCYSVIGIYGVAGSGKTTFARYIRDYIEEECKEEKLFDTIIRIHVSETFSVDVIFQEMLKDITNNRHSKISDREELEDKLKKSLKGKRFFLILDDLWVKSKSDTQLQELICPLNGGKKGSKILVTARTEEAARALCVDQPIKMPDLDEDQYLSMFMHYALGGTNVDDEELIAIGREIAKKLHRSPIAAAIVAGQLGTNPNISYWKNAAKLDMSNGTMDALWWSYQQLSLDVRRCFEYCTIFPRRFGMLNCELVRLWIAQGFVKTGCAREDMEDVAEGYIQELVSCSFLQPERKGYIIHDLLHDLVDVVIGTDCFRIENESSQRGEGGKGDIPRDVRHLFIQNYDAELITREILGLQKLRTLIINVSGKDTPVEEKIIDNICKRLPKLRVLAVAFGWSDGDIYKYDKFSIPESVCQLKHLRYLAFRTKSSCTVILPNTLNKLCHIQLLDFGKGQVSVFTIAELINLRNIFCCPHVKLPNIDKLISLQRMPHFKVWNKQGYEAKQLRNLNKLHGRLEMWHLENVKSKEEALEANLAAKERLTSLSLHWNYYADKMYNPEVDAEVLEGLSPPLGLRTLAIWGYQGSRYPDWMVCKQNDGPKDLQRLCFVECSLLGPAPRIEAFPHLSVLRFWKCSWDTLPENLEHLTSLKELFIFRCPNILSLPTLPQSLVKLNINNHEGELTKSCKTVGHPNWEKIKNIPTKRIGYRPTW